MPGALITQVITQMYTNNTHRDLVLLQQVVVLVLQLQLLAPPLPAQVAVANSRSFRESGGIINARQLCQANTAPNLSGGGTRAAPMMLISVVPNSIIMFAFIAFATVSSTTSNTHICKFLRSVPHSRPSFFLILPVPFLDRCCHLNP